MRFSPGQAARGIGYWRVLPPQQKAEIRSRGRVRSSGGSRTHDRHNASDAAAPILIEVVLAFALLNVLSVVMAIRGGAKRQRH
jgi:hypothetical protein